MNIRQLEAFCTVMETGSMSQAARLLRVSQPAISKSIRLLESSLQLTLFKRTGDRLHPSMEAQRLYPGARKIFEEIAATRALADKLRTAQTGTIKVVATYAMTSAFMTEAILKFHQRWPLIHIELMSLTPAQVIAQIASGEFDIGFLHEPFKADDIQQTFLCDVDLICVVPRNHHLADKPHIEASDLINETVISFGTGVFAGRSLKERSEALGVPWQVSITVNQTAVAVAMASAGIGIAVVDSISLKTMQTPDVLLKPFKPLISLRLSAISAASRPVSKTCQQFIDTVVQVIRDTVSAAPGFQRLLPPA